MQAIPRHRAERLLYFFFIAFTLVFLNVAWVTEDAFITFRAVDNFLKGYGPVWNVGERVQVYTHPLWYVLLIIGIGLFKHHYWVAIALSYSCLMATIYMLLKIAKSAPSIAQVVIALLVLLLSRAFMDYSSSGLENPLLHLLLAGYVLIAIRQQDAAKRFLHTSLLYSLVFLTRPDGIFIITPALLWMLWQAKQQNGGKRTLKLAAIAAAPAVAWEAFSLIYYGSLVPNTALAKVNIDYPRAVLLEQAKNYFSYNLKNDPITLVTIGLTFTFAWLNRSVFAKLLMAGVALQMLYLCHVGADYMLGRFLSASALMTAVSFMLLQFEKWQWGRIVVLAGVGVILLFLPIQYLYNIKYSIYFKDSESINGMEDERGSHLQQQHLGLTTVVVKHAWNPYTHPWIAGTFARCIPDNPNICIGGGMGMNPWSAGEKPYIIDYNAITEPYLARLPARSHRKPGHYARVLPRGYLETLAWGKNVIVDEKLAKLYDDVQHAVRGKIFSRERWESIWRLNTGHYKNLGVHFDRDDPALWQFIIPREFISSEDKATFERCLGDRPVGFPFFCSLPPFGVPPAFSPFIQQPEAQAH